MPDAFIARCTQDSKFNVIVRDKEAPPLLWPRHLDEMIAVAEALERDLDFARVDLFYPTMKP